MKPSKKGDELSAVEELLMSSPKKRPVSHSQDEEDSEDSATKDAEDAGDGMEVEVHSEKEPKGDPGELIASIQAKLDELSSML